MNNSTNASTLCFEATLKDAALQPIASFLPALQAAIMSITFVFGIGFNVFVVVLVTTSKELKLREFALALQVVASDFIVLMVLPVNIIFRVAGVSSLVPEGCYALGFVFILSSTVRYATMFVLAVDRFSAVFFPFCYSTKGPRFIFPLTVATWVAALLLAVVPIAFECMGYDIVSGLCTIATSPSCGTFCFTYRYVFDIALFTTGAILPIVLYTLMFWKARQLERSVVAAESMTVNDESQKRARNTLFLIFVVFMGCTLPLILVAFLRPLSIDHATFYWTSTGLSVTLLQMYVVVDPLLIIRHRDVRYCAIALFKKCTNRNYRASVIPQSVLKEAQPAQRINTTP